MLASEDTACNPPLLSWFWLGVGTTNDQKTHEWVLGQGDKS